ncbi:MAG TPA: ABC transporter permease [Gemmatimonadaceae bacterium]|nr:ABC transporter permease [Gemmatimonadaceae bacterium]
MGRVPAWRRYLRFRGPDPDADVTDEIQFHLEMRARRNEAAGMDPDEAWRAAVERFGDLDTIGGELRDHDRRRERARQRREYMSDFAQDLRYGLRALRRTPAFALVAILTLALGIGATTAIFSVVNAVILRPLPYPDADGLVMVWMDNRRMGMREDIHSWPNYEDLRSQNVVFDRMAFYGFAGFNVTGGCPEESCEPRRIAGAFSSADLFPVLGVAPLLGRTFTDDDATEGNDAVVVLSHRMWASQLGSDPAAVGRTLRLNGRERTVIGVMPPAFAFPAAETDAWIPFVVSPQLREARSSFGFWVIGRLRPGVSLDRAQADMSTIMRRLEEEYPSNRDYGINLVSLPRQVVGPSLRAALWVMLGAVAAVLLIACANVANLMLSRAASREREVGVRLALGAGRARLVRQLLTESVLLAVFGGVVGVALAWAGLRILLGVAPADIPRLDQVAIDPLVLGVTAAITIVTGIAFGLVPALRASRPDLTSALREGGRSDTAGLRGNRLRRLLAAGQVALVVVLLVGAGLLIRSFLELQRVHLGFQPDNLLTMRIALPVARYQQQPQRVAFFESLVERAAAIPGVQGAGAISTIFLTQTPNSTNFTIEGRPRTRDIDNVEVPLDAVTPGYFTTMGIPLRAGRFFTAADDGEAPRVVIINETMARRFWPNEDPIGKRFRYGGEEGNAPWMEIVGVVGDMRRTGYEAPVRYETFQPHAQRPLTALSFVVRTAGNPLTLVQAIHGEVRALDSEQPVYEVASMDQLLAGMVAQRRFTMVLLGAFAGLALVLGVVGVYGVTSYLVAQRTKEVGLRLALGAEPGALVGMVVRQGMLVAAIGIGLGLAGALALTRLMASLLYEVSPTDVATLAAVTVVLAAVTLLANWVPARRAARVDPLVALRAE